MPKMHINKSIVINAPAEEIYSKVSDFHHWQSWSPWLIMDADAVVKVEPNGKAYSWEGGRIGSGNMKVSSEVQNKKMVADLNFLKPWKSYAKIGLDLEVKGDATVVTWTMDSSLPFFMFWMKKSMEAYVGMDYDRGLKMLKDLVEVGKPRTELAIMGNHTYNETKYLGIKSDTTIQGMGEDMQSKIGQLMAFADSKSVNPTGDLFSIYHKWDVKDSRATYTIAIPIATEDFDVTGDFYKGTIPKTKVHTIEHKGDYQHLGNAWGLQYMMLRNKEFKGNKKIHPFEVYKNNPLDTPAEELLTEVHFAIK